MAMPSSCSGRRVTEQLSIVRLGHRGDGVAETANGPVYVPYALPGEIVTVDPIKGHPDRRHLLRIEKASHERCETVCKHFGACGGCALQHWSLAEYHLWKRSLVLEALAQANVVAPVGDLIDAHGQGRRRAVFHARRGVHGVLEVGFTAPRAHHIVAIDACPILAPGLAGALPAAWATAETLKAAGKPLDIQATATDSGLDIDVRGSGALSVAHRTALARIAENTQTCTADAAWRTRGAARAAFVAGRSRSSAVAAGCVPASDNRGRSNAGAAGAAIPRQSQTRR